MKTINWLSMLGMVAVGCGKGDTVRQETIPDAAPGMGGTTLVMGTGGADVGGASAGSSGSGVGGSLGGSGGSGGSRKDAGGLGDVSAVDANPVDSTTRDDASTGSVDMGPPADALPSGSCRSTSDCPTSKPVAGQPYTTWTCVASDETAPPSLISGVSPLVCTVSSYCPNWCGSSGSCPTLPTAPNGTGRSCTTAADCSQSSPTVGAVASLCAGGKCTQCAVDADCPSTAPACAAIGTNSVAFRMCSECGKDSQCPAAHPFCVVPTYLGGRCADCRTTADCADGVCSGTYTCVSGCSSDSACGNPALRCSSHHRCESVPCNDSTDCPADASCSAGMCHRSACTSDSDCRSNICVKGFCYGSYGRCASQTIGV